MVYFSLFWSAKFYCYLFASVPCQKNVLTEPDFTDRAQVNKYINFLIIWRLYYIYICAIIEFQIIINFYLTYLALFIKTNSLVELLKRLFKNTKTKLQIVFNIPEEEEWLRHRTLFVFSVIKMFFQMRDFDIYILSVFFSNRRITAKTV